MNTHIRVAVYGTLKAGHGNNYLLETAKFVSNARVKGTLYSLGGFPALSVHGNTDVLVELYDVDEPTLAQLDQLEGVPNFYQRNKIDSSEGPAWIYTMDHNDRLSSLPIVKSGEWV